MIDGQDIDTDTRVAMNQPDGIADPEVPSLFVMTALLETTTSNQHQSETKRFRSHEGKRIKGCYFKESS